jgi:hypothetical protein
MTKPATPYGWPKAQEELARGVAPAVVALRLGTSETAVLEQADSLGWPVVYNRNRTADTVERLDA